MKTKLFAFIIALTLLFSIFGCEQKTTDTTESGDLVVAFLNAGTTPTAVDDVEAAVSAYTKEKLGFGVKFKQVNVYDASSIYTNWLAAGEEVDLLNIFGENCLSYVTTKKCRELSSLMTEENCPYIIDNFTKLKATASFGTDGKIYSLGVSAATTYGGYALDIRKDVLENLGLYGTGEGQYTDGQMIGYEDLDKIFAAISTSNDYQTNEKGAKVYACPVVNSLNFASYITTYDPVGDGTYPLAVMMMDKLTGEWDDTIVNYYETDQYKEYVNWMGKWAEKGYIHPDAETTDKSMVDLFKSGQAVCGFLQSTYNLKDQWETAYGYELVMLPFSVPFNMQATVSQGYMIPSKSTRPNMAMKFMDLMYSDAYFNNILMYGVEGQQWKYVDGGGKENGIISEVYSGSRDGYKIGGWWGDHGNIYTVVTEDTDIQVAIERKNKVYDYDLKQQKLSESYVSPSFGFTYDISSQSNRIKNLNSIISRYYTTLNVGAGTIGSDGTYTGPGSTYEEFINAITKAKIQNVVDDKTTQYNNWKATNN